MISRCSRSDRASALHEQRFLFSHALDAERAVRLELDREIVQRRGDRLPEADDPQRRGQADGRPRDAEVVRREDRLDPGDAGVGGEGEELLDGDVADRYAADGDVLAVDEDVAAEV